MLSLGANELVFPLLWGQCFSRRDRVPSDVMHKTLRSGYSPGGPRGPAWPGGPGGPGGPGTGVETLSSPLGP